jgi:acetylornithine deacetylase/succinyl-diaminopimelate desuccinylase-like protein
LEEVTDEDWRAVIDANLTTTFLCARAVVPATDLFERVLGAKTLFFSFSTSDENLHAPNEFLRVRRLREGMRAWELLWRLLATPDYPLAEGTPGD